MPAFFGRDNPDDMATSLALYMSYTEWPQIDATFVDVYQSLPGYDLDIDGWLSIAWGA